ncbi:ABC transporter ATP-binding protein [Halomonas sp. BC04]|uniref:ABC transporter ATP-binding protein n=1 Tax=Halomonas sp. BC04 TaxID=1403540 RepID=UPI0004B119D8|nr:ABC transporter ATP-binding protein [Halomonas sp. BC04]
MMTIEKNLLNVSKLKVEFDTEDGVVCAVNNVDLTIKPGETVTIVGESGSGKSVASQSIIGTLPTPPARIVSGHIDFDGIDVLSLKPSARRKLAGSRIAMISQDAQSALDSRFTVGYQIGEMFHHHWGWSWKRSKAAAVDLLKKVQIPNAEARVNEYPHQFSGGMQQRAVIAAAIALNPQLLIADEPTTALDVTVQAEIMQLLKDLKDDLGLSMILVTHDLAQAYEISDRVVVMYAGRIVEQGTRAQIFQSPAHPYTRGLLAAMPRIDQGKSELSIIPGTTPNLVNLPSGCSFHPRCSYCIAVCKATIPEKVDVGNHQLSACHLAGDIKRLASPIANADPVAKDTEEAK